MIENDFLKDTGMKFANGESIGVGLSRIHLLRREFGLVCVLSERIQFSFAMNIYLHSFRYVTKKRKILEKNHTISLQTKILIQEFSMKFEFQIKRTLQLNTLYREKLIRIKLRNFHKRKSLTSTSAIWKLWRNRKIHRDELRFEKKQEE